MDKSLIVTVGPWQSVIAAAVLKQREVPPVHVSTLVLLKRGQADLAAGCKFIHELEGYRGDFQILYLDEIQLGFSTERSFNFRDVESVYAPGLGSAGVEWVLTSVVPRASILLYEDGLHFLADDFVLGSSRHLVQGTSFKRIGMSLRFIKNGNARVLGIVKRLKGINRYICGLDNWGADITVQILENEMVGVLERIANALTIFPEVEALYTPVEKEIVLGTNFSAYGHMSPSDEYGCVCEYINSGSPSGEIWWKPHPRADPLFTEYLEGKYPELKIWPRSLMWLPVEIVARKANARELVSLHSSSLIYGKRLCELSVRRLSDAESLLVQSGYTSFLETARKLKEMLD